MFFAFRSAIGAVLLVGTLTHPAIGRQLKVCADPNNMPLSDRSGEGLENKIVQVIADELGASVDYVWWAQRRGFIRHTLNAGLCDLVPGTSAHLKQLRTTSPYYRSGYVFVTRQADHLQLTSLDDPRLKELTIGVQLIGDDGANTPPVQALSRRGVIGNLRGFPVYGNYAERDPVAPIIAAVADGQVDVAIVWGPFAGYFAARQDVPLDVTLVKPEIDGPQLSLIFDISMGFRKTDVALRSEVEVALKKRRADIDTILAAFHVPRLDVPEGGGRGAQ